MELSGAEARQVPYERLHTAYRRPLHSRTRENAASAREVAKWTDYKSFGQLQKHRQIA